MFNFFILLYAEDIILFANSPEEIQNSLNILNNFCNRWKLKVNINKTKVMIFRKGGILPSDQDFFLNGSSLEIVNNFSYLGIVFTTGDSFSNLL